jgi:hypothetical protein
MEVDQGLDIDYTIYREPSGIPYSPQTASSPLW